MRVGGGGTLEHHLPAVSTLHALGSTSAFYRGSGDHPSMQRVEFSETGHSSVKTLGLFFILTEGMLIDF